MRRVSLTKLIAAPTKYGGDLSFMSDLRNTLDPCEKAHKKRFATRPKIPQKCQWSMIGFILET